jgi:hypothetical protein
MRHGCWLVALQKLPGHGAFGNVSIGTISAIDPNYVPRQYQFALKMKCPDESAPRLDTNF